MKLRSFGLGVLVASSAVGSCAAPTRSDDPVVEAPTPTIAQASAKLVDLGRWVGTVDPATGSVTMSVDTDTTGALTTQAPLSSTPNAQMMFNQLGQVYVGSATPKTYGGKGGPNANTCTLGSGGTVMTICAALVLQAITPTGYNDVWIELTHLDAGVTVRTNQYSTAVAWETAVLATSPQIAWRFGNVLPGVSQASPGPQSAESDWVFDSTSSATFTFGVHALGVRSLPSYTTTVTTAKPNVAGFQNACSPSVPPADATPIAGGLQQIGTGATSTFGLTTSPFPITIFDKTSETVWFSSSGVAGVGSVPAADHPTSTTLPGPATSNFLNAVYPFWTSQKTGSTYQAGGVCTAVTGTAPNRALVVTWADMSFTTEIGTTKSDLYYSVVFHEGTDVVDIQHYFPLGGPASYLYGGGTGAQGVTIGIQGNAATAAEYGHSGGIVDPPNTQLTIPGTATNILLPYSRRDVTTLTFTPG